MDSAGFGSLINMMRQGQGGGYGIPNGGILGGIQRMMAPQPGAAPQVPADGAMQPTIGPGAGAPAAAPAPIRAGLPQGGILGLLQGQSPQGLMGLLQRATAGAGAAPLAGAMPQAGMLPTGRGAAWIGNMASRGSNSSPMDQPMPVSPFGEGPQPVRLPTEINPMNQF